MKAEIETYRGWLIQFDTEKEKFILSSDEYDRQDEKTSYASVKKFIDDFIKDNVTFKPFYIQKSPLSFWSDDIQLKVIGIRKDNKFIYEDSKGEKKTISQSDEKDYMIVNEFNAPAFEKLKEISNKRDALNKEERKIKEGEFVIALLSDIKRDYVTA